MTAWTIERLDLEGDEARLRAAHAVEDAIDRETVPDDHRPFEEWISFRHQPSWMRMPVWVAVGSEGQVLGLGRVRFSDTDNLQLGWGWLGVAGPHRRTGVGSALLRAITEEVVTDGRTLLSIGFNKGNGGEPFLSRFGMEERSVGFHNRTRVAEIDPEMLREWVEQRTDRAADYELRVWEGSTPDELTERFAKARAIMNTAPTDDLDYEDEVMTPAMQRELDDVWRARGFEWTTMAAMAPDGEIAGYTQMFFSRWRPEMGFQEDTGVHPAHRNRGIGRWLKAAMLLHVLEQRPSVEKVDTGNGRATDPCFRSTPPWASARSSSGGPGRPRPSSF
jgi:mycothiol synthase